ncbi:MFS general substrate transporter [Auricularia subglabra TFB-10046 SS5]|uniref:MFS general substrate transporter n=1 Tax=Auricularia subglabra (strain TFB-10046 / SS5) TaxID=717982 RepID=J0D9J6_AURST|nr:MFS general substrate transporter [Auricularia subglabra TFB-10046 SS5]
MPTEKVAIFDTDVDSRVSDNPADNVQRAQQQSEVDVTVGLVAGLNDDELIARDSRLLRVKLDWRLLPLLWLLYTRMSALGASSILGLIGDAHLSAEQFNTLGSAFYIGYLVFEWPQAWALQRFPVAKWVLFNIFLWAVFLGLHPICKSFGSLFALRFLLGASEGAVTAGLMLVTGMFYTRAELGERLGWTFQCNGFAQVVSGFISFGVYHVNPNSKPNQWHWLMIAVAILTFVCACIFLALFPDNPATAGFLGPEEKHLVIRRVRDNQNGIETKKWKKEQFNEALRDPKTWLFFLFAAVSNLQNGMGVQYSIIIKSFGFTTLQTTLLNIPSGVAQIMGITLGCYMLRKMPNSRAYLAILFFMPSVLSAILLMTLPFHNKVGLLSSFYVMSFGGAPSFVFVVTWVASTCAGHTKRLTTNTIFLIGYAVGQILCTQFWRVRYRPRNLVPWGLCLASYAGDFILILAIRTLFDRENKRRDALQRERREEEEFGWVEVNGERKRVHKSLLDLTDCENLSFRYVL